MGEPSDNKKFLARLLQQYSIDWNLHIVISQSQREIDEDRHLVEDRKEHREGTAQGKMDDREEEDEISSAGYRFHSHPIRIEE